jgi:DNA-binding NarL/FixJ family response regulator
VCHTHGQVQCRGELNVQLGSKGLGSNRLFSVMGQDFLVIGRSNRPIIPDVLSTAEGKVYSLLVQGLAKADIARQRETSLGTVSNQLRRIYQKLSVCGRTELLAQVSWHEE